MYMNEVTVICPEKHEVVVRIDDNQVEFQTEKMGIDDIHFLTISGQKIRCEVCNSFVTKYWCEEGKHCTPPYQPCKICGRYYEPKRRC